MTDAAPTFAEQMVEAIQATLLANAGASTVTFDGQTTSFENLEQKLAYWESRVAKEAATPTRPVFSAVKLSGGTSL